MIQPLISVFILILTYLYAQNIWAASGITYHGRIIRPDNSPVTSPTTQFRIQVRTPGAENCLLWEEQQTKDLSNTSGVFTITINDTNEPSLIANTLSFGLDRIFSNRTTFTGLTGCTAGTTYNPNTLDGRSLVVFFRENSGASWEQIPASKINFVPASLNSLQLAGYQPHEFLRIDPYPSQTSLTNAQVDSLVQIINGTSNQYLKSADTAAGDLSGTFAAPVVNGIQGVGVSATAPTLNQVLKFNGTAWAPATESMPGDASYAAKGAVQFLTDQATSGIQVAAGVASLPNLITAGGPTGNAQTIPVITYDTKGRLTAVSTAVVDDNTKLPLAGGTMTGSIDMGNQNITNVTSVSATSLGSRSLRLFDADNSNYVDLQTPTAVATNYALTLPVDDGTAGQVLTTDGNGVLSWVDNGAGSGDIRNGGNTFGANATIGTNDNFALSLVTNAAPRLHISNTGNVGIGTTSPTRRLEVTDSIRMSNYWGNIEISTNIGCQHAKLQGDGGNGRPGLEFAQGNCSPYDTRIYRSSNNVLRTPGSLLVDGNVGIGTTAPSSILDVAGALTVREMAAPALSSADQGRIYFDSIENKFKVSENGGAYVDLVGGGSDNLGNHTATQNIALGINWLSGDGGNEGVSVDPTGYVGVGNNLPNYLLDVSGGFFHAGVNSQSIPPSDNTNGGLIVGWNRLSGGGQAEVNLYNAYDLSSTTGLAFLFSQKTGASTVNDLMSLSKSGRLGIGTTAPSAALHVVGATGTAGSPNGAAGLIVNGGNGFASGNGSGGGISITGGNATGTGLGGDVNITSGDGVNASYTRAGNINIAPGTGWSQSTTTILGGNFGGGGAPSLTLSGSGSVTTGSVTLRTSDGNGTTGATGSLVLQTGNVSPGYGNVNAGNISIIAGNGGAATSNGGAVSITAGNGGTSGANNGANVVINPGARNSTGTDGNVVLSYFSG
ncbi:MAG: beta strand repeat-containing protein, partial [Bdellovibrionales bacterium]